VETPPSRVTKCGKYERNRGDSNDCTSRYCTGEPLRSENAKGQTLGLRLRTAPANLRYSEWAISAFRVQIHGRAGREGRKWHTHGRLALQSCMLQFRPRPGKSLPPARNGGRTKAPRIRASSCMSIHFTAHSKDQRLSSHGPRRNERRRPGEV
jgi:hypothetical protein